MPPAGATPVSLAQLWGEGGSDAVERFTTQCVLPSSSASERLTQRGLEAAFYDPAFGDIAVWEDFVVRLGRCGMLDFVDEGAVIETTEEACAQVVAATDPARKQKDCNDDNEPVWNLR